MSLVLFLFCYFAMSKAFAEPSGKTFIATDKLIEESNLSNAANVKNAIRQFGIKEGSPACSLTFVSNTGYAITARHCISDSFPANTKTSKEVSPDLVIEELDLSEILGSKIKIFLHQNAHFSIGDFKGQMRVFEQNQIETHARVVSVISGSILENKMETYERFVISRERNLESFSDIAVLKFDLGSVSCVKDSSHSKGQSVAMLGYPGYRPDTDERLTEINPPVISLGEVCSIDNRSFDNILSHYSSVMKIINFLSIQSHMKGFKRINNEFSAYLIFHSAILSPGASGSGLFDMNGNVVGVNVSKMNFPIDPKKNPEETFIPGSYIAVPIQRVKDIILSQGVDPNEVFNCK